MKSLAWFTHSGNLGYVPAMYNTAMIFYHGTLDGTVRPNKKAALIWFEKVQKEGEGQVDV
jgi:TPR repeat protein